MGERAVTLSEDDQCLLAMNASGMRMASIAATMGWTERRVTARLAKLAVAAERAGAEPAAAELADPATEPLLFWLSALAAMLPAMAAVQAARGLARLNETLPVIASVLAVQGIARVVKSLPSMAVAVRVFPPKPLPSTIASSDCSPLPRAGELVGLSMILPPDVPTPVVARPATAAPVTGGIVRWTAEEDVLLRESLADGQRDPIGRVVRASGRSEYAVRARMQKLGLRLFGAAAPVPTLDQPPLPVRGAPRRAMRAVGERAGVETLRTLTPARLRYAGWFHQAGWHVEEVAYLFDLPVGDLAQALGVMQ
jgi:hypothetical protein